MARKDKQDLPVKKKKDVLEAMRESERERRRLRLMLCVPLLAAILALSLLSILRPRTFYNLLHSQPLAPGASPLGLGLDLKGGARVVYEIVREPTLSDSEYLTYQEQTRVLLHDRIATFGNLEPNVSLDPAQGQIIVELPGVENQQAIAQLIGETGKLEFILLAEGDASETSAGGQLSPEVAENILATRRDLEEVKVEREPRTQRRLLTLRYKEDRELEINLRFAENRGRRVAIAISGRVFEVLQISKSFSGTGGASAITSESGLSETEAQRYEYLFKWQALPLDLLEVSRDFISPTMGEEALLSAYVALSMGAVLVIALLLLLYGTFLGVIGCLSLAFCGMIIWGTLNATGGVLTLSSLAGLLLTLGISVDSFILVFEGIKDEIRRRVAARLTPFDEDAIWEQLRRVVRRLVALRLTTAAAAAVLLFAEGPVRSFAWMLLVGLAAEWIVASRPVLGGFLILLLSHGSSVSRTTYGFPAFQAKAFKKSLESILRFRGRIAMGSLAISCVMCLVILTVEPATGLDVGGGSQVRIRTGSDVPRTQLVEALEEGLPARAVLSVQKGLLVSEEDTAVWIVSVNKGKASQFYDLPEELQGALAAADVRAEILGVLNIQPRLPAKTLARWAGLLALALLAVGLFCLTPMAQISVRGTTVVPALIMLLATAHDLLIALGLVFLLQIELSAAVLVGLLVVVGYSLNDSLVLLWHLGDEVREFGLRDQIVFQKDSVNRILVKIRNRTFNTSLTTLAAVAPAIFLARAEFRGYVIVVATGVLVGTLSSFFVVSHLIDKYISYRLRKEGEARDQAVSI